MQETAGNAADGNPAHLACGGGADKGARDDAIEQDTHGMGELDNQGIEESSTENRAPTGDFEESRTGAVAGSVENDHEASEAAMRDAESKQKVL